jgi:hypothetical protein
MQAHYSDQSVAVMPPVEGEHKLGQYLYQAGIVAAILVFLLSFWSC